MLTMRRPLADDRGFTMVTIMLMMLVTGLMAVGAYAASVGDIPVARIDQDRKGAYEAAQAGIDWYANQLRTDPDYWAKCAPAHDPDAPATDTAALSPITIEDAPPRAWKSVDGDSAAGAPEFRIELLKVAGEPGGCVPASAQKTALDSKGNLSIRATGRANGRYRSVIAVLHRNSDFLRYLYFSNRESQDPQIAAVEAVTATGQSNCDDVRSVRDPATQFTHTFFGVLSVNVVSCVPPKYLAGDMIRGPFHTNDDSLYVCGGTFDTVELPAKNAAKWNATATVQNYPFGGGQANSYGCSGSDGGGAANAIPAAKLNTAADTLLLPPSNVGLKDKAPVGTTARQVGQTCIVLEGAQMRIVKQDNHAPWGSGAGTVADPQKVTCDPIDPLQSPLVNIPGNGVVYVQNDPTVPCTTRIGHNGTTSYTSSTSCGDVAVSGVAASPYTAQLTIAAENDIIINGNLERSGDGMLGLIANNFVRIHHPLSGNPYLYENRETTVSLDSVPCKQFDAAKGRMGAVPFNKVSRIDASVMSLRHTFQVDNMVCEDLGTLTFNGSISLYWGFHSVQTFNGSAFGYAKRDWTYDTRLRTNEPPHFINPLNSDGRWSSARRTEEKPPQKADVPAPTP